VVERDPADEREALHVVEHWRYLGTAREPGDVDDLLAGAHEVAFDRDQYRLLARWLARHPDRVRPLHR